MPWKNEKILSPNEILIEMSNVREKHINLEKDFGSYLREYLLPILPNDLDFSLLKLDKALMSIWSKAAQWSTHSVSIQDEKIWFWETW